MENTTAVQYLGKNKDFLLHAIKPLQKYYGQYHSHAKYILLFVMRKIQPSVLLQDTRVLLQYTRGLSNVHKRQLIFKGGGGFSQNLTKNDRLRNSITYVQELASPCKPKVTSFL